jgi:hypothetical protein
MIKRYAPYSQVVRPGIKNIKDNSPLKYSEIIGLVEAGWKKEANLEYILLIKVGVNQLHVNVDQSTYSPRK